MLGGKEGDEPFRKNSCGTDDGGDYCVHSERCGNRSLRLGESAGGNGEEDGREEEEGRERLTMT